MCLTSLPGIVPQLATSMARKARAKAHPRRQAAASNPEPPQLVSPSHTATPQGGQSLVPISKPDPLPGTPDGRQPAHPLVLGADVAGSPGDSPSSPGAFRLSAEWEVENKTTPEHMTPSPTTAGGGSPGDLRPPWGGVGSPASSGLSPGSRLGPGGPRVQWGSTGSTGSAESPAQGSGLSPGGSPKLNSSLDFGRVEAQPYPNANDADFLDDVSGTLDGSPLVFDFPGSGLPALPAIAEEGQRRRRRKLPVGDRAFPMSLHSSSYVSLDEESADLPPMPKHDMSVPHMVAQPLTPSPTTTVMRRTPSPPQRALRVEWASTSPAYSSSGSHEDDDA